MYLQDHATRVPSNLFSTADPGALSEELFHFEVALRHLVRHFLLMSDTMTRHVTASAHDVVMSRHAEEKPALRQKLLWALRDTYTVY